MHFKQILYVGFLLASMLATGAVWAADAARVVFAVGEAQVAGRPARVGDIVSEGQQLTTSRDGYLYLETLDNGFFILRPNSAGQIVTYQIDAANPANSRIKLELTKGVARHISGTAVKASRQNFRFNTPVAAIGVLGTDFTVFANQETTRIAVLSGGVVVGPLTGACAPGGFGPCGGPDSRELFASKIGQTLQINRGQAPVLLKGIDAVPDSVAPPRADEPTGNTGSKTTVSGSAPTISTTAPASVSLATNSSLDPIRAKQLSQLSNQAGTQALTSVGSQPLIWGRWQPLLDKTIEVDVAALQATNQLIAINNYFAIMRSRDTTWQMPTQTTLGFALQQAQAAITNQTSGQVSIAKVENALLQLDFAKSSFFTRFDLVNQNERIQLQNNGEVSADGKLYGGNQQLRPNNMDVRGALANDNRSAAYIFQSRLDDSRLASGVTVWGR